MLRARSDTPLGVESPEPHPGPLRPIIHETIRTQLCRRDVKYLVDRLDVLAQRDEGKAKESFRLWLSDGEKLIQAILRRHAHPYVISGDICVGSYVRLIDYELIQLPRITGEGSIWLLAISDLCAVGHDGREFSEFGWEEMEVPRKEVPTPQISQEREASPESTEASPTKLGEDGATDGIERTSRQEPTALPRPLSEPCLERGSPLPTLRKRTSDDMAPLSTLDVNVARTPSRANKRMRRGPYNRTPNKKTLEEQTNELRAHLMAVQSTPSKQKTRATTETPAASPSKTTKVDSPAPRHVQTLPAPQPAAPAMPSAKPIPRPLKITRLADVTGPKATRNTVHDFVVIITHVNPRLLVRKGFPDSREILIMDLSTPKQVHVTVFVDAAIFLPEPGTVVLLRNLTTHEYDSGSLKAYVQKCADKQWFVPETPGWEWKQLATDLKERYEKKPEGWILPDRIWWTERGMHREQRH